LPVFLSLVSDFAARRSLRKSKTTGKTPPAWHFCRYLARRENLQNRKLPAKPLSLGTFAGISQPSLRLCCSPLATEIENYRQNPSRMALLLVSPTFRMILVCPIGRDTHTTPDKKLIMPSRRPKITF